jgi:hypothetical protein
MCGCNEQKYSYTPGAENVNEKRSSVSSAFDLNNLVVEVTVCGMSSSLIHVTMAPGFTNKRGWVEGEVLNFHRILRYARR